MFYFNRKLFLLVIIFALTCKFCSGQAQVSENAPKDLTEHLLNLDLQNLLHFTVTASDGKMSRIDVVSDSASAWSHGATGTNTATFTGVPNQGKAGTYRPQFSGEVTKDGQGKGDPKKYDWAAKAKYELNPIAKFTIYVDQPVPGKREIYHLKFSEFIFGHSFWQIETRPEVVSTLSDGLKPYANATFGYYPTKTDNLNPFLGQVEEQGIIRNDKNHTWNVKKEYNIFEKDELIALLNFTIHKKTNPGKYHICNNNCTAVAIQAGEAAGLPIPSTVRDYQFNIPSRFRFIGNNPGDLGEDLVSQGGERGTGGGGSTTK